MQCKFIVAWQGQCTEEAVEGMDCCEKHNAMHCKSCGKPATHTCDETGQFVCGAPLCDDCEHTIAEDGTNGGIGFVQTSPYPEGYSDHCKKTDQKYTPWYRRKEDNDAGLRILS